MKNVSKLKRDYEKACNQYIKTFCEKQEMEFEFWVANDVGGIAVIGDCYFNFQDIVWDINAQIVEGLILEWYYAQLDNPEKSINYYSYTKGLRHNDLK